MMFGWHRRRKQLLQEFEQHLALETHENLDAGMSEQEAYRAARQKFGSALTAVEASREAWGGVWLERLAQGGDLGAPHDEMVYLDNLQLPATSFLNELFAMAAQYAIRSPLAPAALVAEVRAVVRQDAPGMVEMSLEPMEDGIDRSLGQRRLALRLVASFAGAALVLSAVGIYGVLAYAVSRRRREIGIRMALGSTRPEAAKLVVRQAGAMVLLGLLPGICGAWAAAHLVRGFLYGVQPLDGLTLLAVGGVLLIVAGCAVSIPALRAASVDPLEALRVE